MFPKSTAYILLLLCLAWPQDQRAASPSDPKDWMLGPFTKVDSVNPVLFPSHRPTFTCPVQCASVRWEQKNVFNPAAAVKGGKLFLLYRAEDGFWDYRSTSRLGLASSDDGLKFRKRPEPVLYPDDDSMQVYEWPGGCEDPRIVEDGNGMFVLTYTAWNGNIARLAVATSADLIHWTKRGLAFAQARAYRDVWSKSGAIVCTPVGDRLVAQKINGRYWMYWGDSDIFFATSENLIDWTPLEFPEGRTNPQGERLGPGKERLLSALSVRHGRFDSRLVESGPPAILTPRGIVLIYNGSAGEDSDLPVGTYAAGQALFDASDPRKLLDRSEGYFLKPEHSYELSGNVAHVCFVEGLVPFNGKYYLYYGTADSKIAVAEAPGR